MDVFKMMWCHSWCTQEGCIEQETRVCRKQTQKQVNTQRDKEALHAGG